MSKFLNRKRDARHGRKRGGRPSNASQYPRGLSFDAERFRFELERQDITLRELVDKINADGKIHAVRTTVWRWTQCNVYPYPNGSAPPVPVVSVLERILGVPLLKKTRK